MKIKTLHSIRVEDVVIVFEKDSREPFKDNIFFIFTNSILTNNNPLPYHIDVNNLFYKVVNLLCFYNKSVIKSIAIADKLFHNHLDFLIGQMKGKSYINYIHLYSEFMERFQEIFKDSITEYFDVIDIDKEFVESLIKLYENFFDNLHIDVNNFC